MLQVGELAKSLANYDIECVRDPHAATSQARADGATPKGADRPVRTRRRFGRPCTSEERSLDVKVYLSCSLWVVYQVTRVCNRYDDV